MRLFVDTSAFLAVINANDRYHPEAKKAWQTILDGDVRLTTSNYVLLETTALLQHRFGMEGLRLFINSILPIMQIIWVDPVYHQLGMSGLLAASRRDLSLVDCISFAVMRQEALELVFAFDVHFQEQGFTLIPNLSHP